MRNSDKNLVVGCNAVDGTFQYIFDFTAKKGYVGELGHSGRVVQFDLTVENIAKAAYTGEWVESDEECEIDENAQIMSISDIWRDALQSETDDEKDMTDVKAHIGMIFLILDLVRIPAFSVTSVAKIVKSVKNGQTSQTDGYQAIVDGLGYEIVVA
jgi:hypothetical protein